MRAHGKTRIKKDGTLAEGEIMKIEKSSNIPCNFLMRMFELKPGGHTPLHAHPHEHEVFVTEGQGILTYEGKEHKFSSDYVIFVPGNKEHNFKNTGDSILRFLCLIPAATG